jgi:hypothetical protein
MNKAELVARYLRVCGTEAAVQLVVSKLLIKIADEDELLSAINARLDYEKLFVREDEEEE